VVNGLDGLTRDTGDIANSFEFMFDINTGTAETPVWLNVPELTGLQPQHSPVRQDATVYADQGTTSSRKTGSDFTLEFNLLKKRDAITGEFQASWLALKDAADAVGDDNNLEVRYYDSRGASEAYQGVCSVARGPRPQTGNAEVGWDNFQFTSVARVVPIANPLIVDES
jgi:hypothetical protein